ncbi:hypothetical protein E5S67_01804 [Microcoleus sp. IPMA8]|uniref:Uncharacterized protein n=1 Tax=Microcoleus asticus IPMA8 TaxID=2563858 RepID=A0ABX2CUR2_9CYAN|nr:hypothetical protein [Microcoleus asticus IPMA8]
MQEWEHPEILGNVFRTYIVSDATGNTIKCLETTIA